MDAQAVGKYQHDFIQTSLLREWKIKTKQPIDDDPYYDGDLDAAPRDTTVPEASSNNRAPPVMKRTHAVRLLFALLVLSGLISYIYNQKHQSKPDLSRPVISSTPNILQLPATMRPADEEAFDRIAWALPGRWQAWLINPPYLAAVWPEYPTESIRQLHAGLAQLARSRSAHSIISASRLIDHLRHADGFDDQESVYLPHPKHRWLRDAAECWQSTPPVLDRIYCPLRHPRTVLSVNEFILDPLTTYLQGELDLLRHASLLLSRLQVHSTRQQADTLLAVHDLMSEAARERFPIADHFGHGHHHQNHDDHPKVPRVRDKLTTLYTHYSQSAFFELITTTLQPEFTTRIQRLEDFLRSVGAQRTLLQTSSLRAAIPLFYRTTRDWIAGDAAYALNLYRFVNGSNMHIRACEWTVLRMPLAVEAGSHSGDNAPSHVGHYHEEHSSGGEKPTMTPSLRDRRIQLYNDLVSHLWLSRSAASPPSVRWHWDDGGSMSPGAEQRVAKEWDRYVQGQFTQVWEQSMQMGRGDDDAKKLQDLLRLPPRWDEMELRSTWPKLRARRECRAMHEGEGGERGEKGTEEREGYRLEFV